MRKLDRSELLRELKFEFPEIRDELNKQFGFIGEEISVFQKFLQILIKDKDIEKTEKAMQIVNKYHAEGRSNIKSLISLMVTEDLDFSISSKSDKSWAYNLLSEELKSERNDWRKFMGYSGV